jgi:hypothetical protein
LSASAAEILRQEGDEVLRVHQERLSRAMEVVREALESALDDLDPTWESLTERLVAALRSRDLERFESLVMQAYRRVLFERAGGREVKLPDEAEWGRLPDALTEFRRRYGKPE